MKKYWKKIGAFVLTILMVSQIFLSDGLSMTTEAAGPKLAISHQTMKIVAGQSATLKVTGATKTVKWSTSNKKIATVSKNGKVNARKTGKCTIKAKVGKSQVTCKVTVNKVGLNKTKLDLGIKDSATLKVLRNKKKVIWTSTNKKIVTVSKKGKLTAKKAGKATIKAKVGKNTYKCVVTVKNNNKSSKDRNGAYNYSYEPEVMIDELKKEKAYTVTEVSDGIQITIKRDSRTKEVESGDVVVLPDKQGKPYVAMKVDTVRNAGSKLVYTGTAAEYTDIFEKIDIGYNKQETFDGFEFNQSMVDTSAHSTINDGMQGTSSKAAGSASLEAEDGLGNKFLIKKKADGIVLEAKQASGLFGSVEMKNPKVSLDIDVKVNDKGVKANKVKATVTEDVYTSLGYKNSVKNPNTGKKMEWYLGHKECYVKAGFFVDIVYYLQLGVNGEFSVKTKTTATMGIDYRNNKLKTIHTSEFQPNEVKVEASGNLGFEVKLNLRFGGYWNNNLRKAQWEVGIIGFEGFLGPAFKAKNITHATKPYLCQTIDFYLSLNLKISDFGIYNLLKSMKLKTEWKPLDDNKSNPFRFTWHYEDGKRVNECTFGKDIGDDIVVETELKDNWNYILDTHNKTVNLVEYIGTDTDVVVHGSYLVGGERYATEMTSGSYMTTDGCVIKQSAFHDNDRITSVKIENGVTSLCASHMFSGCHALKSLDLRGLDTSQVTGMSEMFSGCSGLTSLDLSDFNTEQVICMLNMFRGCSGLTSLDLRGFDTSQVTNMNAMFMDCSGLTSLDLEGFDTSQVTDMGAMFNCCSGLRGLNLSSFNTEQVTDMDDMFCLCSNLTSLNLSSFNTGKVTDMSDMFGSCERLTSLDLRGFDTSQVTDMEEMFCLCSNLTSLNLSSFNTGKVTNMRDMFGSCERLTSLDLRGFDTSQVTDMSDMFFGCSSLTNITVSDRWVTEQAATKDMFYGCGTDHVTLI